VIILEESARDNELVTLDESARENEVITLEESADENELVTLEGEHEESARDSKENVCITILRLVGVTLLYLLQLVELLKIVTLVNSDWYHYLGSEFYVLDACLMGLIFSVYSEYNGVTYDILYAEKKSKDESGEALLNLATNYFTGILVVLFFRIKQILYNIFSYVLIILGNDYVETNQMKALRRKYNVGWIHMISEPLIIFQILHFHFAQQTGAYYGSSAGSLIFSIAVDVIIIISTIIWVMYEANHEKKSMHDILSIDGIYQTA